MRSCAAGTQSPPLEPTPTWTNGAALLDAGVDVCLAVAEEDSERAASLRQASPLACLLTNDERFRFLKEWKARPAQG